MIRKSPPSFHRSGRLLNYATAFLVIGSLGTGCGKNADGREATELEESTPADQSRIDKQIRDLVAAVTPFDPALPKGEQNLWFHRRRDTLESMRAADPAVGRTALQAFHDRKRDLVEIRIGLLDVAAHTLPDETRDLLIELTSEYGADLGLRTKACEFLAATSPEQAVEVLGPILLNTDRARTYPPDDKMLSAWLAAMNALGRDPSNDLATLVADLQQSQEMRHRAAKALGDHPGARGIAALETVIVESAGNNYLRRLAAQSLQKCLEPEELCRKLREIGEKEADVQFQLFLADMIDKNCP